MDTPKQVSNSCSITEEEIKSIINRKEYTYISTIDELLRTNKQEIITKNKEVGTHKDVKLNLKEEMDLNLKGRFKVEVKFEEEGASFYLKEVIPYKIGQVFEELDGNDLYILSQIAPDTITFIGFDGNRFTEGHKVLSGAVNKISQKDIDVLNGNTGNFKLVANSIKEYYENK